MTTTSTTSTTGPRGPGLGLTLEKAAIAFGALVAGVVGLVHGTGWLLAVATGHRTPRFDVTRATLLLRGEPYVRQVPITAHIALLLAVLTLLGLVLLVVIRLRARRLASDAHRAKAFDRLPGLASAAAVRKSNSVKHLQAQATHLRPSLTNPRPTDVGYFLGHSRGQDVWVSCERSVLVVGPPRSGKGEYVVINALLDAPGAVVTTSTKPDNLKATLRARAARGPVGIFDPQGMIAPGVGHVIAWDAVAGCEDPMRAVIRAEAMAANTGIGEGNENRIWRQHAKTVIETVLHAAALQGLDIETAYRWMQSEHTLDPAIAILEHHPDACPTWDDRLRGIATNPDPRFTGSVMSVVAAAIAPLALPTARAALTPTPQRPGLTAEQWLATNTTLYCLATDKGAAAAAGLASAFIEDIAYVARRAAARSVGGRLDPPPLFLLDECANVAPIPSLPSFLADGSGQNMTIISAFQTMAQIRSRYGDKDAATIFSASQVKFILGGTDDPNDLRNVSTLVGERDDWYTTISRSALTLALDTKANESGALRRVPILPPDMISAIPMGCAVMLQSQTQPMPLLMRDRKTRPDAAQIMADTAIIEAELLAAARRQL